MMTSNIKLHNELSYIMHPINLSSAFLLNKGAAGFADAERGYN